MIGKGTPIEMSEGNVWKLRYDTAAFMALEDVTGIALGRIQEKLGEASISMVVKVIWAGLIWAEPKLTIQEVAKRFDVKLLEGAAESIAAAFEDALGVTEEEDEEEEGNPPPPTG